MNEEESLKKKFGCRVKYLRKMNRITQEQLSGMIHIEPPNLFTIMATCSFSIWPDLYE